MSRYIILTNEKEPTLECTSTTEIPVDHYRVVLSWGCLADAVDAGRELQAVVCHRACWLYLYSRFGLQLGAVENAFLLSVDVFGVN